jgi:hypothetical protein
MAIIHPQPLELRLHPHELMHISHVQPKTSIQCREGVLWITCSGDRMRERSLDILLSAGEHYIPATNGHVVIEAMSDASLRLTQEHAPRGLRLFGILPA